MYKRNVNNQNVGKSNLLYVLFLPFIMYLYHFMYGNSSVNNESGLSQINNLQKIQNNANSLGVVQENSIFDSIRSSDPLLTSPFPESTINTSTSSSK